jgi:hypothetical protein
VIYPVAVLITAPGHITQPGAPHPETAPSDRLRYVHTDVAVASYGWRKLSDARTARRVYAHASRHGASGDSR